MTDTTQFVLFIALMGVFGAVAVNPLADRIGVFPTILVAAALSVVGAIWVNA